MLNSLGVQSQSARGIIGTSIFCFIIAIATSSVWGAPFYEHILISFGYGLSAIICSFVIDRCFPNLAQQRLSTVILSLTASVCLGSLNAYFIVSKYPGFDDLSGLKPVIFLGLIFTVCCFYYFYSQEKHIALQKEVQDAKRLQTEQEKALIEGQLKQLQSQIEPHFLFNTLANINALIEYDTKAAKAMLEKLTELLRGSLASHRAKTVTLQSEMDLVSAYLGIQKIRLGDRLEFTIEADESVRNHNIPPFVIQPLVENAIQHGIEPSVDGGRITITSTIEDRMIRVAVFDTGLGLMSGVSTAGCGVGLDNIRLRLHKLYGDKAQCSIKENPSGGVTSLLVCPISDS
jgi:sensor histidine kinase YesM